MLGCNIKFLFREMLSMREGIENASNNLQKETSFTVIFTWSNKYKVVVDQALRKLRRYCLLHNSHLLDLEAITLAQEVGEGSKIARFDFRWGRGLGLITYLTYDSVNKHSKIWKPCANVHVILWSWVRLIVMIIKIIWQLARKAPRNTQQLQGWSGER